MAGDVPVWPDNMALMTVKGGCLQATIADTKESMKTVKRCMENAGEGLNPYEMILQYP